MSQASTEVTAAEIENKFATPAGVVVFPTFCNALIVAAGPAVASFPSLSEQPGPDGGKDGEWVITDDAALAQSPFTSAGWNIFQFKAVGIGAKGRDAAISALNRALDRAIHKFIDRLETPNIPAHYTAFTNLQLGLATPILNASDARLSTHLERLEQAIRHDAPAGVRVSIMHAATLAALVNAHPALKLAFFSENVGISWDEKSHVEQSVSSFGASIPLIGRDGEMQRVGDWLSDGNTRVVAITGPSGMGKTRLALEATRARAAQTIVIDRADRFDDSALTALAGADRDTVLLIEDPSRDLANRIAKQAVATARLKVVLTIPTRQDAPDPRLLGHPAIQTLSLGPLAKEGAEKLLEAARVHLDSRARDWILLQAGGIPAVLLAAAEAGNDLREHAGRLREQLGSRFSRTVEAKLGCEALKALQMLSPMQWVNVAPDSPEFTLLLESQDASLSEAEARQLLSPLQQEGYLRRRGNYVAVVPPLFGAALARESLQHTPRIARELFAGLNPSSRERLLERIVTLDLGEDAALWDYFFGPEGAFSTPEQAIQNLSLLNFLARAVPRRVVRFFRVHYQSIKTQVNCSEEDRGRDKLRAVLGELLDEPETSADAVEFMKLLAIDEITRGAAQRATAEFCECFVHWYPFPVAYAARADIIRTLVASSHAGERELGLRALAAATNPPQTLSGRSVHARRLGPEPPRQLMRDRWQYLEELMQLRLELSASSGTSAAELPKKDLIHALETLDRDLPVPRFLPLLERVVAAHVKGQLGSDDRDVRSVLHALRSHWTKSRDEPGQEHYVSEWADAIGRLDKLIAHFDEAPFARRLNIAVGRVLAYDYEEVEGERLYGFQKRIRSLAAEAAAEPTLMTDAAWNALYQTDSYNATEFAIALGIFDERQAFLSGLEERADDWRTAALLAFYLAEQHKKGLVWVEQRIDKLIRRPNFARVAVLQVLKVIGPTEANVRRLLMMIDNKVVTPLEVAQTFSTGKWLDDLPVADVAKVFDYIATGDDVTVWLAGDLSLYLHHEKPLPRELFAVAGEVLMSQPGRSAGHNYDFDRIALGLAKTDLHAGLQLLAEQIERIAARPREISRWHHWNPVEGYAERHFWEYLRDHAPEEAYRILGGFRPPGSWIGFRSLNRRELLDVSKHLAILRNIASENKAAGLVLISAMSVKQPGFFDFAYAVIELYPSDPDIRMGLITTTVERAGFGSDLDHLEDAAKRIAGQLATERLPERASIWLREVQRYIEEQRHDYFRYFGRHDEFLGWD